MSGVEEWLCRQNIALLRGRLAEVKTDAERSTIERLLAEQQARLDELTNDPPEGEGGAG